MPENFPGKTPKEIPLGIVVGAILVADISLFAGLILSGMSEGVAMGFVIVMDLGFLYLRVRANK